MPGLGLGLGIGLSSAGGTGDPPAGGTGDPPPELVLDLDADNLVLANNDPMATWPDATANAFDFTAAGTAQPLYKTGGANGHPYVQFDGVDDYLGRGSLPPLGSAGQFTAILVTQVDNTAVSGAWFSKGPVENFAADILWGWDSSGVAFWQVNNGDDGTAVPASGTQPSGLTIQVVRFNGSLVGNANRLKIQLNGVNAALAFSGGTVPVTTGSGGGARLGSYVAYPNGFFLNGKIYVFRLFNTALTDADLAPMVSALGTRYGGGGVTPLFRYSAGDSLATATTSRGSTATYRDASGVIQTAASGVLRDNHYELDPVSGLYVRHTLTEGQRTNHCPYSQEIENSGWLGGVTKGAAVADPTGGVSGRSVTIFPDDALYQLTNLGGSGTNTASIWARVNSGTAQFRLDIVDQSVANNPSLDFTATTAWQRFTYTFTTASWAAKFFQVSSPSNGAGATIELFGAQLEPGAFASSYIPTTSAAVTRAADSLSFPYTAPPQEMTVYVRFIEGGTRVTNPARLLTIGDASANQTYLTLYPNTGAYEVFHYDGSTSVKSSIAPAPVVGDRVELLGILAANGSVTGQESVNAATAIVGTASAPQALRAQFGGTLYVGYEYGSNHGFSSFRDIIILPGTKTLAECRALL